MLQEIRLDIFIDKKIIIFFLSEKKITSKIPKRTIKQHSFTIIYRTLMQISHVSSLSKGTLEFCNMGTLNILEY